MIAVPTEAVLDSRQLDFADYLNEPNKIFEVLQRNLLGKTSDENRTYTS